MQITVGNRAISEGNQSVSKGVIIWTEITGSLSRTCLDRFGLQKLLFAENIFLSNCK